MNARVKKDYRWNNVLAFCGIEFTKGEYRPVPKGYEDEAAKHPFLEIEPEAVKKVEPVEKLDNVSINETPEKDLIKTSDEKPARKKAEK